MPIHLGEAHTTWDLAPFILAATVLMPVVLLTLLISLAAVVAVFGSKRRSERAMRIFDAALGALMALIDAVLRTGSGRRSRSGADGVRRSRR
ncbi:hypothetical protein ACFVVM_16800 [Nocardia sp. NPDC058176]|uniref:hypothetical protein n=1 Tax=Nocardia sp. NPDC058176 TaxID=3346368 RepID=UPI0036DA5C96